MRRTLLKIIVFYSCVFALSSCKTITNSNNHNNSKEIEQVTITFIQHTFISFSYNENKETNGYYFENDELAKTCFYFDKAYDLLSNDISSFDESLNYELPTLVGDDYWSFTFFTTSFDSDSGLANNYLKPCKLEENLIVHFGIYG